MDLYPLRIAYLFGYAFLLAAAEVEIEGRYGWAERLPTWFRTRGVAARIWGFLAHGRPLTGYHLFLAPFTLASFHLPFVFGVPWSVGFELELMANYLAWVVFWDYLWFLLNPAYGFAGFRKGRVWWHAGWWWGRFPADYFFALAISLALATGAASVLAQLQLIGSMVVGTIFVGLLSPLYHRWYRAMRDPDRDDRTRACISHSSDVKPRGT